MARYIKDNFYGGMSEDDVLGGPDKYLYSDGIDVTGNSNFIQLANAPTEAIDTGSDVPEGVMSVVSNTFGVQPNVLAFTDSGIFRDDTVGAIEGNVWQEANFVIGDTMYFVKNNGNTAVFTLYSEPVDSILTSGSPVLTVVTTVGALSTNNTYFNNGVTVLGDIAYIWLGDKVCRFEPTAGDVVTEFDIFGDDIIFISYVGGYFRVYTKSGKLMLWDGNTTTIAESIDLKLPLKKGYQIGNIDYLYTDILGNQKGLYYMSGYDLVPLFKARVSEATGEDKFKFDGDGMVAMANYGETLFGYTENGVLDSQTYSFGKHIEGLPSAFMGLPKYSSYGLEYTFIRGICVQGNELFYGFNDGTNKGVDKIDISNRNQIKIKDGTLITNVNPLGAGLYKKTSKYLYFKVGDIDADRTIEVQISYDGGAYTSLGTITEQPLDNIARLPIQGDFRDFTLKFILATTVSTSRSPKLYYGYAFDYEQHDI